jgi:hypothetical protein
MMGWDGRKFLNLAICSAGQVVSISRGLRGRQRSPSKGFNRFEVDSTFTAANRWNGLVKDRQAREPISAFNRPGSGWTEIKESKVTIG